KLSSTARASRPSRVIRIESEVLLGLCRDGEELAYLLTREAARSAMQRLYDTRVLLAAALA
ncbi:MAG TPA: hypothetical protein VJ436_14380, partial [Anaerolineales bacterium]|nr:hypothetical protein [Anaerolineales bacterium]